MYSFKITMGKSKRDTLSDDGEEQDRQPLLSFAIEEVLNNSKTDDARLISKKVIERLVYYFLIKQKMDESEEFVDNIETSANDIHDNMGGAMESAYRHVLQSYRQFIEEEIKNDLQSDSDEDDDDDCETDDDEDEEDNEDEEDFDEDGDLDDEEDTGNDTNDGEESDAMDDWASDA